MLVLRHEAACFGPGQRPGHGAHPASTQSPMCNASELWGCATQRLPGWTGTERCLQRRFAGPEVSEHVMAVAVVAVMRSERVTVTEAVMDAEHVMVRTAAAVMAS